MADPITTPDYIDQYGDLLVQLINGTMTETEFENALLPLTLSWMGDAINPAALGANLNNTLANWMNFITSMTTFFTITPTGGPNGNGTFVVVDYLGVSHTLDGYQKIAAGMAKGDPGQIAVVFEETGRPPPNEIRGRYVSPGSQVLTDTASIGYSEVAATNSFTYTIKKNGVAAGTATFAASSSTPVFAFTGGQISVVRGDKITLQTPSSADPTLADVTLTLASN